MPKLAMNNAQREIAEEMKDFCQTGLVKIGEVKKYLGYKDDDSVREFLRDVPHYDLLRNGAKRYRVSDIARKISNCRVG